ncbi:MULTISPECIES: hypothetical protein [unclassified Nocardiopsis]|uniref:hypothetical protein n=1 Tax=unclassified Nocardiopsis TaxID=2649073 RepID=UPI003410E995
MRIGAALRELHHAESSLVTELSRVADRHAKEQEIQHVTTDLAVWSREHLSEIVSVAPRYGVTLTDLRSTDPEKEGSRELPGEGSDPDLALLADLRRLYRMSGGVALDWDLLGQGAQVVADPGLLAVARRCQPRSLRQMRWARAMLKTLSPQILAS